MSGIVSSRKDKQKWIIRKGRSMTSRSREVILSSALLLWGTTWSTTSSSGAFSTGMIWTYWSGSRGGPWRWSEDWSTSPESKRWESWACSAWRREGSRDTL